jgi:hypothetical protein
MALLRVQLDAQADRAGGGAVRKAMSPGRPIRRETP